MDIRDNQFVDNLGKVLSDENILSPTDISRVLPLYIKVFNDRGVVRNVSLAYIKAYDGKSIYKKFGKYFDQLYSMFLKNSIEVKDRHVVFKRVAERVNSVPKTVKGMQYLVKVVIDETRKVMKMNRLETARKNLICRFSNAVKKYLGLSFQLGFNEPSICAKTLAETHKIDKYIMSGDFSVILLPFLPELEKTIRNSYEHYEMQDAWELLKGRYFNHRDEYNNLAIEIKSAFKQSIPNFSEYFDRIYTDTYYKKMLEQRRKT